MSGPRAVLHRDPDLPTIHLIRHAQGFHQLPVEAPREDLPDPDITPYGEMQCKHLQEAFPHHDTVDLLCASPIRRAIQTARIAFAPVISRGHKILLIPNAQESSDKPMDIPSTLDALKDEFGELCDYSLLEADPDFRAKKGLRRNEMTALYERARQLRVWLRERPEKQIVLVSHGLFAHFLTGNIDATGLQTGEYWSNVRWRSFAFGSKEFPSAIFVETEASMKRAEDGLNPVHPDLDGSVKGVHGSEEAKSGDKV